MSTYQSIAEILLVVQLYFDMMYDCDVARFNQVFCTTANLHGFRDGKMTAWSAPQYKDLLAERQSPQSVGAPRAEEVLLIDIASESQALVKVRVQIHDAFFVDYLSFHRIDGDWLITSKAYHREPI